MAIMYLPLKIVLITVTRLPKILILRRLCLYRHNRRYTPKKSKAIAFILDRFSLSTAAKLFYLGYFSAQYLRKLNTICYKSKSARGLKVSIWRIFS